MLQGGARTDRRLGFDVVEATGRPDATVEAHPTAEAEPYPTAASGDIEDMAMPGTETPATDRAAIWAEAASNA
ncbi:hypothetical protein CKO45_25240 [Paracraurococcus ruber]|uniref:Uncharacterized protein n=1 Tax=Paracraurococcus ruber TaxID=77675 RepID=A0ABS1D4U5_9PROT|nr:hypothetical protein [Paracraurococcus ruber]